MEPANAVRIVLPFFVIKLFKLKPKAVKKDIFDLPCFSLISFNSSTPSNGSVSSITSPSSNLTILVE